MKKPTRNPYHLMKTVHKWRPKHSTAIRTAKAFIHQALAMQSANLVLAQVHQEERKSYQPCHQLLAPNWEDPTEILDLMLVIKFFYFSQRISQLSGMFKFDTHLWSKVLVN